MKPILLHEDRLFPVDEKTRGIARELYQSVRDLPIISPHGHTDPRWFAYDENFGNATELFILPDHYVFRMLYSQGITLEQLGIRRWDGGESEADPRKIWQLFADHYYLFPGTPSRMWLDTVFKNVFGLTDMLCSDNAMDYYEFITKELAKPEYKPRALMDRFNIELIATTEGALDPLTHHGAIKGTGWDKRVITTFRPDDVVDASREDFVDNIAKLGDKTLPAGRVIWPHCVSAVRYSVNTALPRQTTATRLPPPQIYLSLNAKACLRKCCQGIPQPQSRNCSVHRCLPNWPA